MDSGSPFHSARSDGGAGGLFPALSDSSVRLASCDNLREKGEESLLLLGEGRCGGMKASALELVVCDAMGSSPLPDPLRFIRPTARPYGVGCG